jgi:hypothetical protein
MSVEELKAEMKKLNARTTQAKIDLHALSENLPQGRENILAITQRAYDAFAHLTAQRAALKQTEGG